MFTMPLSAHAGWKYVTSSNQSDHYFDTGTIKKRGGYHYFWKLDDYFQSVGCFDDRCWSVVWYAQLDCDIGKFRWLDVTFYSKNMGKGYGKKAKPTTEWSFTQPGTVILALADQVCKY